MDKEKQAVTSLFHKKPPKTVSLKTSIIINILFLMIGIWIGIFIFSSINSHFAGNNQPIETKQKIIIKPAQNKTTGPKIVVIGSSSGAESPLPSETESSSPASSSSFVEKNIVVEKIKHPIVASSVTAKRPKRKTKVTIKHVKHWEIQVASYKIKRNAIRMLKKLGLISLSAHIKSVKREKTHFYRVLISYKGSRKGVAAIVIRIKTKLHITPFVYDPIS